MAYKSEDARMTFIPEKPKGIKPRTETQEQLEEARQRGFDEGYAAATEEEEMRE